MTTIADIKPADGNCYKSADNGIKALGLNAYTIAHVAFKWRHSSPQAAELAERWKLLWARYGSLSDRYRDWVHKARSLRLHPFELSRRYKEIDAGFDALTPAMETLNDDLEKWAETWEPVEEREVA